MIKRTKAEWERLLGEYWTSGMTQAEWCRRNGVKYRTLRDRLKKESVGNDEKKNENRKTERAIKWVEVKQEKDGPTPNTAEISPDYTGTDFTKPSAGITVTVGEFNINVKTGFDEAVFKAVCKAMISI